MLSRHYTASSLSSPHLRRVVVTRANYTSVREKQQAALGTYHILLLCHNPAAQGNTESVCECESVV